MNSSHRTFLIGASVVALWGVTLGSGIYRMSLFASNPGPVSASPAIWPEGTSLPRCSGRATLLLFAHPRCPCTSASLAQLKQIAAEAKAPFDCLIVFLTPPGAGAEWKSSHIVVAARSIPNSTIAFDDAGAEARRFAASTSGYVLLYDPAGQLMFSGGITIARGHLGDNLGTESLIQLLNRGPAAKPRTPVFGCPLFQDPPCCREDSGCRR